jgi:acetoin utilization protein AcuB
MLVSEILNNNRPPLRASDAVSDGCEAMKKQQTSRVAVIDFTTRKFLGEVLSDDLDSAGSQSKSIMAYLNKTPYVIRFDTHIMDVAGKMMRDNQNVAYITDSENNYFGTITKEDLIAPLTSLLNLTEAGSVIIVELNERDYALSDIVRVIELEGVKILGIGVQPVGEQKDKFHVSIKLNDFEIYKVLHVLNRYGYVIVSETATEDNQSELHERADELMRYLSI